MNLARLFISPHLAALPTLHQTSGDTGAQMLLRTRSISECAGAEHQVLHRTPFKWTRGQLWSLGEGSGYKGVALLGVGPLLGPSAYRDLELLA